MQLSGTILDATVGTVPPFLATSPTVFEYNTPSSTRRGDDEGSVGARHPSVRRVFSCPAPRDRGDLAEEIVAWLLRGGHTLRKISMWEVPGEHGRGWTAVVTYEP